MVDDIIEMIYDPGSYIYSFNSIGEVASHSSINHYIFALKLKWLSELYYRLSYRNNKNQIESKN